MMCGCRIGVEKNQFHIVYEFIGHAFRASCRGSSPGNSSFLTQIFVLNSAYGLMTAVAAMDAGAIPASLSGRILVAVNAAIILEAAPGIGDAAHLATYQQAEAVNRLIVAALDDGDG